MLLNLSKFSWRSRIQGIRGPPVLATASMMRLVRWQCAVLSISSPLSYLYIDYKMPKNISRCLYFVPSARFLPPLGRSRSGASVSCPSLTSDLIQIFFSIDHVQGCTTTSSERMGNRCTLGIGTLFSTTTPAFPPGFGTTGRTTEVWLSAFLQRRLSF